MTREAYLNDSFSQRVMWRFHCPIHERSTILISWIYMILPQYFENSKFLNTVIVHCGKRLVDYPQADGRSFEGTVVTEDGSGKLWMIYCMLYRFTWLAKGHNLMLVNAQLVGVRLGSPTNSDELGVYFTHPHRVFPLHRLTWLAASGRFVLHTSSCFLLCIQYFVASYWLV